MERQLEELARIAIYENETIGSNIPIICAGDIFDDGWREYKCPPCLINFAIRNLPKMFGIPGQHDLVHHSLDKIKESAFWTLVEAGTIIPLMPDKPVEIFGEKVMRLHGFPWSIPVKSLENHSNLAVEIAVVHDYIWIPGKNYAGADNKNRLKNRLKDLQGYDIAVFGDNHKGFCYKSSSKGLTVVNCGGFFRRKSDERDYEPSVWLLYYDGSVKQRKLDVGKDIFTSTKIKNKKGDTLNTKEFVKELLSLGDAAINFGEAVRQRFNDSNVSLEVQKIILEALEGR